MNRLFPRTVHARLLLSVLFICCAPVPLWAIEGRLVLPSGAPAANLQVTIEGRSGSVRTDEQGRFNITPSPPPNAVVVVFGRRGELYEPIVASELTAEPYQLRVTHEEVTVVGVAANTVGSPAAAASTITQEDLEQRNPSRLVDAIATLPGVSRTEEGASGVPVVRGMARGRTLILLDDARVTSERRAGASATYLDPFILGSVEVTRGPGSVAYGSDSFGGVVHARPRDPVPGETNVRFDVSAGFGSLADRAAGLEGAFSVGRGALSIAVYGRKSDEAEAGGGTRIGNSQAATRGAMARFFMPFRESVFRAALQIDRGEDIGKPATDSNVTRAFYPREESNRLTLSYDHGPAAGWSSIEARAFFGSYRLVTDRERQPAATVTRQLNRADNDADDASFRLQANRPIAGGRFAVGVDTSSRFNLHSIGERRTYDTRDQPTGVTREISVDDAMKRDAGVFALFDRPLAAAVTLGAGLRVDRVDNENRGGFFGNRTSDHTALSGHLALATRLREDLTATLQVASGFRDPTLSDRYFRGVSGRGFVAGNPDLDPERSAQFDGSIRWQRRRNAVSFFVYDYRIRGLIERYRNGADFNFRNRGEAEIRGFEIEGESRLIERLTMQYGATWAKGEALDDGTALADIPPPSLSTMIRYGVPRWHAFVRGFAAARDDRPGPTEIDRAGYATLDAGAGFAMTRALELRLIGSNLLDKRYRESADEAAAFAPGRGLSVGIVGRY